MNSFLKEDASCYWSFSTAPPADHSERLGPNQAVVGSGQTEVLVLTNQKTLADPGRSEPEPEAEAEPLGFMSDLHHEGPATDLLPYWSDWRRTGF